MRQDKIYILPLGQAGFQLQFGDMIVYIDPYLTDIVADTESADLHRLVPVPMRPEAVTDATLVLITHHHLDHCDPDTLLPLSQSSRSCSFICPNEVVPYLLRLGIDAARVIAAPESWLPWGDHLRLLAVPAAHTAIERDPMNALRYVGYVIDYKGRKVYHSGDTSPHELIIATVRDAGPIDCAILPVNERNYFRERRGIIGNMSIREAFAFASEIGAKKLIPMHWDMFGPNSVYREEIELLYGKLRPDFELLLDAVAV